MTTDAQPNAALLAELNGALGKAEPAQIDPLPAQAPALADQLEIKPQASTAARAAAARATQIDKTHGKSAGGYGYRVWVEGEYYAKSPEVKGHVIKTYRLSFNLPQLVNAKNESALGIIVGASRPGGGLLKAALKQMDPFAESYRTHAITSVEPLNGASEPTSLQHLSFEALKKYVQDNPQMQDFPIALDLYWDVAHLREDVIDFKTNQTGEVVFEPGTLSESKLKGGFGVKKTPSQRIRERHEMRLEEKELSDMNPGFSEPVHTSTHSNTNANAKEAAPSHA